MPSATGTTTSLRGTEVYCPWCSHTSKAPESETTIDCQLLYQVPTSTNRTLEHFVFVFNHDATYLVHTSMVTSSRPFDLWFISPDEVDRPNDGLHIVFMPPQVANNTIIPLV